LPRSFVDQVSLAIAEAVCARPLEPAPYAPRSLRQWLVGRAAHEQRRPSEQQKWCQGTSAPHGGERQTNAAYDARRPSASDPRVHVIGYGHDVESSFHGFLLA